MSSTPEQRAKWREKSRQQRLAKKKALETKPTRRYMRRTVEPYQDALVFLRHAEREINNELRSGKVKKLGKPALLTLLALSSLSEGDRTE